MRYQIEVNGIVEVETGTRDMAVFIARTLSKYWLNANDPKTIEIYKEGELILSL